MNTQNNFQSLLFRFLFIIVFNIFFFVLDGNLDNNSVAFAYAYIHLAYFLMVLTPIFARKSKHSVDLIRPINVISGLYFAASLIFGLIIISVQPQELKPTFLIGIAIFALYLFLLLGNLLVNNHTESQVEETAKELVYIKDISSQLHILKSKIKSKELAYKIEEAYDLIHSSPAQSHPTVKNIEVNIQIQVSQIAQFLETDEEIKVYPILQDICNAANERNRILKTLN